MIYFSDVELLQKALEQPDLLPKYREHIKLRIEESSPVDYREINIPQPTFEAVSNFLWICRMGLIDALLKTIAPLVQD